MKIEKIRKDGLIEILREHQLSLTHKDGQLVINFSTWDSRKNDYKVIIPANELIDLASSAANLVNKNNGSCPSTLKIIWER